MSATLYQGQVYANSKLNYNRKSAVVCSWSCMGSCRQCQESFAIAPIMHIGQPVMMAAEITSRQGEQHCMSLSELSSTVMGVYSNANYVTGRPKAVARPIRNADVPTDGNRKERIEEEKEQGLPGASLPSKPCCCLTSCKRFSRSVNISTSTF